MSDLEHAAERAATAHNKRRSVLFLEAAIGALLQCLSVAEVKRMLREHAEHLEEFV